MKTNYSNKSSLPALTISAIFACSATSTEIPIAPVTKAPTLPQTPTQITSEVPLKHVYALKQTPVHKPRNGKAVGQVMAGARLPVYEEVKAAGCKGKWLKIQLESWICSEVTKPAPDGVEADTHYENRAPHQRATTIRDTPVYNAPAGEKTRVLSSGSEVRAFRIIDFEGGSYTQIAAFEYVDADALWYRGHRSWSTHWEGLQLAKETKFPYAVFTDLEVPLFANSGETELTKSIGLKHRYEHESVLEMASVGAKNFARVKAGWFLVTEGAVVVEEEPRPKDVPPGLPWVLIDISDQTLVGYDASDELVFLTLISGGKRNPTVTGNFGLTRKYRYSTMAGNMFGEDYRVDDVPWAQFFYHGYAIHGAFWHDKFGYRASHGCVNVAPADAMWLAGFLEPHLPNGWLVMYPPEAGLDTSHVVVRQ
jgi:hypothetical protein